MLLSLASVSHSAKSSYKLQLSVLLLFHNYSPNILILPPANEKKESLLAFLSDCFSTSPSVCRPGGCAVQGSRFSSSTTLPDEVLNFVKTHPLMDETVPLLGHRPWVVKTMGRYTE